MPDGARRSMSEEEWQQQVIDLARTLGWRSCHVRRSIGKRDGWTTATSVVGWPDLVLWSERRRRLLFVELKSRTGVVSAAQREVLLSLRVAGQEVHVWRPDDLDAAREVLSARPAVAGNVSPPWAAARRWR